MGRRASHEVVDNCLFLMHSVEFGDHGKGHF